MRQQSGSNQKQVGRAPTCLNLFVHALHTMQSSHEAPSSVHDLGDTSLKKVST